MNLTGENFEEMGCCRRLGVDMAANGTVEGEVRHSVGEGGLSYK